MGYIQFYLLNLSIILSQTIFETYLGEDQATEDKIVILVYLLNLE